MNDRAKIINALNSSDEELRLQGLREIALDDPMQYLNLIFERFGDESWRVRKEAIGLFLASPAKHTMIGEVIDLLHADDNAGLRNAAVEILVGTGREAVPLLLEQSSCPDHDVRKFIVDILGDIADARAIPVLIEALSDADSNVRAAAAENLGKIKAAAGVPALLKAMEQTDLLLRFTILDTLSRIGEPVDVSHLRPYKDEKLLRKALMDCLGKVGDASAIPELIDSLDDDMRNVREAALLALASIAVRHPEEVRSALRDRSAEPLAQVVVGYLEQDVAVEMQRAAIQVLGWMGAESAIVRLLDLLNSEALQQDSLMALVNIGLINPQSLVQAWGKVDIPQRAYLAYIFGEACCSNGLDLLKKSLGDDNQQLKRMSAYALGKLGGAEILPELVNCLLESTGDVQEATTQALISLGSRFENETLKALLPLLNNNEPDKRKSAVSIIGRLSGKDVLDALGMALKDPEAEVRREAVKAFDGRETTEYVSNILLALTDEDAEVRKTAVDILSGSRAEEALDGLQLALRDEDIWVRSAAVRGLGRVGGEQSLALVEQAVDDPVGLVSIAALETLAILAGERACPMLIAALDHRDEEVVNAALGLLANCGTGDWLAAHMEALINHPFWAVRTHFARYAAQALGRQAVPLLKERLSIESEEVVCQQLQDLLADLKAAEH